MSPAAVESPYNGVDDDCDGSTPDDDLDGDGAGLAADCDDQDAAVGPSSAELPYNGVNDDCDAATPDDDLDGDGALNAIDCDDGDSAVGPAAPEILDNGVDDDCDPATPDTGSFDGDGDGYGPGTDCDDGNAAVNPGEVEVPYNGVDDDCDVATLDDDLDGDGAPLGPDCDDGDPAIGPSQPEIPNNVVDDDCDAGTLDSPPPAPFDLALATSWFAGDNTGDQVGNLGLASIGDADGDGEIDLAIGAVFNDDGGPDAGAAWTFDGPYSGVYDLGIDGVELTGDGQTAQAGYVLAPVGDLDGDLLPDLLVGSPSWDPPGNAIGQAYLVSGLVAADGPLSTSSFARITGTGTADLLGNSVAGLGDTDGDGLDDVLVGAPGENTAVDGRGAAYVYLGPVSGDHVASVDADATFLGNQTLEHVGWSVAGAGDTDGDGLADALIGADLADTSGNTDGGAAFLFQGPVAGVADVGTADARLDAESDGDRAGVAVAGVGDFNGDGFDDVAVGAFFLGSGPYSNNGAAYVVEGPMTGGIDLGTAALRIYGDMDDLFVGVAVAAAGDVDGDSLPDLVLGCPDADDGATDGGAVFVFRGGTAGVLQLHDAPASATGSSASDGSGRGVAAAGDVDHDGKGDLLIGAPNADYGGPDTGTAWLVLGSDLF